MAWPGVAAVSVSLIHLSKTPPLGDRRLNGRSVDYISEFLDESRPIGEPFVLAANEGKSHAGSHIYGTGFTVPPEEAASLIAKNTNYKEVLFPFLRGDDVLSRPDQSPSRWVINFFDWPLARAANYPECLERVRELVKPERDLVKRKVYRERWWQFAEQQKALYRAISGLGRALFHPFTSKYLCFVFVPTDYVFATPHVVIALDSDAAFSVLQSSVHEAWVRQFGSTLGSTLRYPPTDCFQKFPFPLTSPNADAASRAYYELRQKIALDRQVGLTEVYNQLHDQGEAAVDVARLRELHAELDLAVAAAYGWSDLDLNHEFRDTKQGVRHTISETARRTILDRLLALNHQRHAEETSAGQQKKTAKSARGRSKADGASPTLFG